MKISVLIPHHYGLQGVDGPLKRCVNSMVGHDEIIVFANDGMGYGAAVNRGLELTSGDHIVLANNDTWIKYGTLRSMAVNNVITTPIIEPSPRDLNPRCFFCVPRFIYEGIIKKYGYFYDENFSVGYWEDDDLIMRLRELGIETRLIKSVTVGHQDGGGLSMKQMGEQKFYDQNKKIFQEKWNLPEE